MTPDIQTGFAPADGSTLALCEQLYSEIDHRRTHGGDKALHINLICSCLALRQAEEFSVPAKSLTAPERNAISNILGRHTGSFLRRTSGRARYCVNPNLPATLVVDTSEPRTLATRIGNNFVKSYSSPNRIPSIDYATLLGLHRGVHLDWVSVPQTLQRLLFSEDLPNRWETLADPPQSSVEDIVGHSFHGDTTTVLQALREEINRLFAKHRWSAVLLPDDDAKAPFTFAVPQHQADRFTTDLTSMLQPFFKANSLPPVLFSTVIHRTDGTTITQPGHDVYGALRKKHFGEAVL